MSSAKMIGGSDSIFARVEDSRMHDIQSDETKIIVSSKSGANGNWTTILEPFDSHRWIAHGFQTTFQMNVLALAHWFRIAQWLHEYWL